MQMVNLSWKPSTTPTFLTMNLMMLCVQRMCRLCLCYTASVCEGHVLYYATAFSVRRVKKKTCGPPHAHTSTFKSIYFPPCLLLFSSLICCYTLLMIFSCNSWSVQVFCQKIQNFSTWVSVQRKRLDRLVHMWGTRWLEMPYHSS